MKVSATLGVNRVEDLGSLYNKIVLLRVDANVSPTSDRFELHPRVRQVASTIDQLTGAGARVIVVSHRSSSPDLSTEETSNKAIVEKFKECFPNLSPMVHFHERRTKELNSPDQGERSYFRRLYAKIKKLPVGHAVFTENIRIFPSESSERLEARTRRLARMVDLVINDGFGVGHRGGQFSVDGLAREIPFERKGIGPSALEEWQQVINFARGAAPRSIAVVLGGDVGKFESKLKLVITMLKSDRIGLVYLGGVFGTSYLHAHGCELGRTPVSKNTRALDKLRDLPANFPNVRFELPAEYVGINERKEITRWPVSGDIKHPQVQTCQGCVALDQGTYDFPTLFDTHLISRVVAVGLLGYYTKKPFDEGTTRNYRSLVTWTMADDARMLLVGGGNSMEALLDIPEFRSPPTSSLMVSSGGGALLNALAEVFTSLEEKQPIQTPSIQALRATR
jgi:phosphoglycerate kinase